MSAFQRGKQLVACSSRSRPLSSSAASCSRTLPRPVATRPASQEHAAVPANLYELKKAYPRHPLLAFFNEDYRDIKLSADSEQKTEVTIPATLRRSDLNTDTNTRGWLAPELRTKSSLELHQLWYKCLMERNKVHTTLDELQRTSSQRLAVLNNYNGYNINRRVKKTMARIKFVLNERRLALLQARAQAEQDRLLGARDSVPEESEGSMYETSTA